MLESSIMHTKLIKSSIFLISLLLIWNFSINVVSAEDEATETATDPYVIALIYTEDGCASCNDLRSQLNTMVEDVNAIFDYRDVNNDVIDGELDLVWETCGVTDQIPIAVFEDECITDTSKILTKAQKAVNNIKLSGAPTDDTATDTDEIDSTTEQTLDSYEESNEPAPKFEVQPIVAIGIIVIPAIFIYGAFYLIKKFSL